MLNSVNTYGRYHARSWAHSNEQEGGERRSIRKHRAQPTLLIWGGAPGEGPRLDLRMRMNGTSPREGGEIFQAEGSAWAKALR